MNDERWHADYVRALEEECARAQTLVGLLRVGCLRGDTDKGMADYLPFVAYRQAIRSRLMAGDPEPQP